MTTKLQAKANVFNGKNFNTTMNIVEKREDKYASGSIFFYRGNNSMWIHESNLKFL